MSSALEASEPDVVATAADAARAGRQPLLVLDPLREYLDELGIGTGAVSAERVGHGSSNATFVLRRGDVRLMLRRPPRPPFPPSTHDVVREARLQLALRPQGVKTPEILAVYEHDDLLGAPFYLMAYVDGAPLVDALPPPLDRDVPSRRLLGEGVVDALVELHAADATTPALARFLRPGDYAERQVRRFSTLWKGHARRTVTAVDEVADWLRRTLPAPLPPTVIHGDYRLGNILFARADPTRVAAVVDWELGAIGDPRADLGYLVATYSDPDGPPLPIALSPATRAPGFATRADLVDRYVARSGRDVTALAWFEVLALWKTAILMEGIYARYLDGELDAAGLAPRLGVGVPRVAAAALRVAERAAA